MRFGFFRGCDLCFGFVSVSVMMIGIGIGLVFVKTERRDRQIGWGEVG